MNRFIGTLFFVAVGIASQFAQINAGMIIGNGSLTDTAFAAGGRTFGAHDGYGKEFTVSANATARGASILMATYPSSNVPTTGTFNVLIYDLGSSTGVVPTSPAIASAQVIASFSATNQGKWYHVDFGTGINLVTTSNYVFAVERVTGSNPDISWAPPTNSSTYSGGTVSSDYLSKSGTYTVLSSGPNFGFQILTEAVPEPTSASIAVILICGGALRRFRRSI